MVRYDDLSKLKNSDCFAYDIISHVETEFKTLISNKIKECFISFSTTIDELQLSGEGLRLMQQ